MGMIIDCGKESLNIGNIIKYLKYKIKFRKEHPDYFEGDGLLCFVGPQGSGKTLSAVNYVYKLMSEFPDLKLCTNLMLSKYPVVTFDEYMMKFIKTVNALKEVLDNEEQVKKQMYALYLNENKVFPFADNDDFSKYNNGEKGVVFLVDEIQLYLNSLESKNVNMEVMVQISQQRKQRKHIVTTSQVFGRMAKPLREQFSNVIVCKNYLGFIQRNSLIDRDSLDTECSSDTQITGKVKKNFLWFHAPDMYKRYDTYYVIQKGKFISGEKQKEGIYNAAEYKLPSSN